MEGADVLLPMVEAEALLGDKAYDAQERVIGPLTHRGIEVVIPPKKNRKEQGNYDQRLVQSTSSDRKYISQTQTVSSDRALDMINVRLTSWEGFIW